MWASASQIDRIPPTACSHLMCMHVGQLWKSMVPTPALKPSGSSEYGVPEPPPQPELPLPLQTWQSDGWLAAALYLVKPRPLAGLV